VFKHICNQYTLELYDGTPYHNIEQNFIRPIMQRIIKKVTPKQTSKEISIKRLEGY
jgi:hypothetical protein